MEQELLQIIRKNLPEQAANEMKLFIEQAQQTKNLLNKTKEDLEIAQQTIQDLNKRSNEQEKRIIDLLAKEKAIEAIKVREDVVYKRELEIKMLELKIQEAEKRAESIYGLTRIVFNNPVYTRTVQASESIPFKGNYGIEYYNKTNNSTIEDKVNKDD